MTSLVKLYTSKHQLLNFEVGSMILSVVVVVTALSSTSVTKTTLSLPAQLLRRAYMSLYTGRYSK